MICRTLIQVLAEARFKLPRPWTKGKLNKTFKGKRKHAISLEKDTRFRKGPWPVIIATSLDMDEGDVDDWIEDQTGQATNSTEQIDDNEKGNWVMWLVDYRIWARLGDEQAGVG